MMTEHLQNVYLDNANVSLFEYSYRLLFRIALNYKSNKCEIGGFHSVVLLVGRFEDFRPNIPEDKHPESRHKYLQYLVVCLHNLYCDGGTRTCFVL